MKVRHLNAAAVDSADEHAFCSELLPWYAGGSLDATRARRVEAHLQTCERCRAEAAHDEAVVEAMSELRGVELAPQAGLARVMERIEARESRRRRWSWPLRVAFGPGVQRPLVIAIAIQALVIVMMTGVLTIALRSAPGSEFRTLSATAIEQVGAPRVRVVFSDELTMGDLRARLEALDATLVAGPEGPGIYTLEVRGSVDDAVTALRGQPGVRFVEPVVSR
jgi:anti-sigma factor RsiW